MRRLPALLGALTLSLALVACGGGDDEDEFRAAVSAGTIDPLEEREALAATREIEALMAAGREPFGSAGWLVLDLVADLRLPPTI